MTKTFLNIRGTNGSGKSTLARRFFGEHDGETDLSEYFTKSGRSKFGTGRINPDTQTLVVGNYDTMAGGLDKLPSFSVQFNCIDVALSLPDVKLVVAEGVLASTVLGSWADHAKQLHEKGVRVIWAFMSTPLQVCLDRIQIRNGGKPIKEDLVKDKIEQIDKVRQRAELLRHIEVVQLPFEREWETIQELLK